MGFSDLVLLLNALWFGGAFIQFSIAQGNTLKILVPREERGNPIAPTLSASVAFLGAVLWGVRRAASVVPVLCRVPLQPVRLQPSGPDAWRTGRRGVLAGVEGTDASDLCHRCGAVCRESRCGLFAGGPFLTNDAPGLAPVGERPRYRSVRLQ